MVAYEKIPSETAAVLWKPVVIRAVVAAAFGVLSIFWREPTVSGIALLTGAYLVLTGSSVWLYARELTVPDAVRRLQSLQAVVLLLAGVVCMLFQTVAVFPLAASLALLFSAAMELILWTKQRRSFPPVRDFLIPGIASLAAGLLLPFFIPGDAQDLFGILGGGAIVSAVMLAIAGLGYRFEARDNGRPGDPAAK